MQSPKKKEGFQGQKSIIIPGRVLAQQCESLPIVRDMYPAAIGYYPNAQYHYRQRIHGVSEHILIYCVAGKGMLKVQNRKYEIVHGSIAIIPANAPHEYGADEASPWTIYWVHFKGANSFDFVQMMIEKLGSHVHTIPFQENRIRLFEDLYASMERGYSRNNISYASIGLQYFLASCCFFENYLVQHEQKKDSTDNAIDFMQQHLDGILNLQDIANAVNMSASHLAAIFKKKTGYSVMEYFNHLKIQKACQYLQFTTLRINEIADKLGMEDPYYFSRMFARYTGSSPMKYRNSYALDLAKPA
jgi:AraC-like DNA-binding protein